MRSTNKGYTLVEVLVSVTISSIVMLGVVLTLTFAFRQYYRLTTNTQLQSEVQAFGDEFYNCLELSDEFYSYDGVYEMYCDVPDDTYYKHDKKWVYFKILDGVVYKIVKTDRVDVNSLTYSDDDYLCRNLDSLTVEDDVTSYKVTMIFKNKGVHNRFVRHVVRSS